jgi:hypothetical protein
MRRGSDRIRLPKEADRPACSGSAAAAKPSALRLSGRVSVSRGLATTPRVPPFRHPTASAPPARSTFHHIPEDPRHAALYTITRW